MRRLPVFAVLLAMMLLIAPVSAFADDAAGSDLVVLAAEEGEEGEEGSEPLGPNPAERTAEDNPARTLAGYEDRELPFTWGAAWLLGFAGFVGLALMGGLYQLLVRGPAQKSKS
jgi:hypothetical protein